MALVSSCRVNVTAIMLLRFVADQNMVVFGSLKLPQPTGRKCSAARGVSGQQLD